MDVIKEETINRKIIELFLITLKFTYVGDSKKADPKNAEPKLNLLASATGAIPEKARLRRTASKENPPT